MTTSAYGRDYFAWPRKEAAASAEVILPVAIELTTPSSVLDVGSGTGAWLEVALAHGITDVFGVDGGSGELAIPADRFRQVVEQPLRLDRRFDLAICLEVAEHLLRRERRR